MNQLSHPTMWGPRSIAKLAQTTTISLGFMVVVTIVEPLKIPLSHLIIRVG